MNLSIENYQIKTIPKNKNLFTWFLEKISSIKKIPARETAIFFRQLAALISAGIPIVQSCAILRESQDNTILQGIITTIRKEIENGKTLAHVTRKFPRYFDKITCQLIHTGEQSGTLEIMLKRIAFHKEKSLLLKNKIKQALFYPILIFIVAILVTLTMLIFVIPQFAELFNNSHNTLPAFTQAILTLSNLVRYHYGIVLSSCLFIGILLFTCKSSVSLSQKFDQIILSLPFIKNIIQKVILARFARNLSITFAAGVPIIDALKMIAETCGNYSYTLAILQLTNAVTQGKQLYSAMSASPLFPSMAIQMVKVGEESGKLDPMLEKIADLYESDLNYWVTNLSQLLEPLIMVILGVLIGGLVIAMYLPIFKLGNII